MDSKEKPARTRQDSIDILDRAAAAQGDARTMPGMKDIYDAAESVRPNDIPNPVNKIRIKDGIVEATKPELEQLSNDCGALSNHAKAEDEAKRQKQVLIDALNNASNPVGSDPAVSGDNEASSTEVEAPATVRRL
ncbi:hypothetical protein ABFU27_03680 [Xanthomonas campestris pv. raphani]|uniref:hypothetical protein n=1 Tax=Xanthomonas campestris TaxID=339 RepID=UPI002B22D7EF|nr:hypothetical protein [Xanthomonas campestris]MEA9860505.1 hypothetical protein [Xanthomonas campestris pv. raphani]MEA9941644.1 hypothetical protein [Xanthomonas campestris pv. raphani]MEC5193966.1 hypothetical protein [Xanthomonas campestris]